MHTPISTVRMLWLLIRFLDCMACYLFLDSYRLHLLFVKLEITSTRILITCSLDRRYSLLLKSLDLTQNLLNMNLLILRLHYLYPRIVTHSSGFEQRSENAGQCSVHNVINYFETIVSSPTDIPSFFCKTNKSRSGDIWTDGKDVMRCDWHQHRHPISVD